MVRTHATVIVKRLVESDDGVEEFFIVQVMYFQEVEPLGEESSGVVKHPK